MTQEEIIFNKYFFTKEESLVYLLRKRYYAIFDKEKRTIPEWSKQIGVNYKTFKTFFLNDRHQPQTLRKFEKALPELEKKYNIDSK